MSLLTRYLLVQDIPFGPKTIEAYLALISHCIENNMPIHAGMFAEALAHWHGYPERNEQ